MERRLAAILAADVVGYSRLMGLQDAVEVRREQLQVCHGQCCGVELLGWQRNVRVAALISGDATQTPTHPGQRV